MSSSRFLLVALCAALATVCVLSAPSKPAPAILALDFGSEWLKGCLANQKSSSIGTHLDVVINEQSARKTPNLLGFDGEDDRILGDAALPLLFRAPAKVFPHAKRLLGQLFSSAATKAYQADFPSLVLAEDPERKTVLFKRTGAEDLSVEEVIVQLLQLSRKQAFEHIKANAEKEDIQPIQEVVVSVPEYFTQSQRRLYSQLITLAGYDEPKAVIFDLTAVAVDYAVRNLQESSGRTRIAFFASGSVGTTASLVQMEWVGDQIQLQVQRTASDPLLGGYSIDTILRDALAERFDKAQKPGTTSIKTNPRSMAKLLREARELKEMLSVSPSIEVQMEELHAGKDFKTTVTQEELHAWTADITQRMLLPLKQVLEGSEKIAGIELFGGSVRSPSLQSAIRTLFPDIPLGKHVDGEESALVGAAHYAGVLTGISKLTKVHVDEKLVLPRVGEKDLTSAKLDLTDAQIASLAKKIKQLDEKAEQRRARDAARNALESALNDARDLVASAPKGKKDIASAAEELIAAGSAFVDDSDKTTTAEAFEEKRTALLAAVEPLRAPKKVEKVEKPSAPRKKRDRRAEHKKAMEENARREKADKAKKEKQEKEAAAKKKAAADKAAKDKKKKNAENDKKNNKSNAKNDKKSGKGNAGKSGKDEL